LDILSGGQSQFFPAPKQVYQIIQNVWPLAPKKIAITPSLPLVLVSDCNSYADIFKKLQKITGIANADLNQAYWKLGRYRPQFQIWQPSSKFKRSDPGPAFRYITVVSMSDQPPCFEDLIGLSLLDTPVTVAMVDDGNISFIDPRPGNVLA